MSCVVHVIYIYLYIGNKYLALRQRNNKVISFFSGMYIARYAPSSSPKWICTLVPTAFCTVCRSDLSRVRGSISNSGWVWLFTFCIVLVVSIDKCICNLAWRRQKARKSQEPSITDLQSLCHCLLCGRLQLHLVVIQNILFTGVMRWLI